MPPWMAVNTGSPITDECQMRNGCALLFLWRLIPMDPTRLVSVTLLSLRYSTIVSSENSMVTVATLRPSSFFSLSSRSARVRSAPGPAGTRSRRAASRTHRRDSEGSLNCQLFLFYMGCFLGESALPYGLVDFTLRVVLAALNLRPSQSSGHSRLQPPWRLEPS